MHVLIVKIWCYQLSVSAFKFVIRFDSLTNCLSFPKIGPFDLATTCSSLYTVCQLCLSVLFYTGITYSLNS